MSLIVVCMYDSAWPSHCDCEPFHWPSQPSDYQSRKNPIPIVTPAGHHYDNHQATDCTLLINVNQSLWFIMRAHIFNVAISTVDHGYYFHNGWPITLKDDIMLSIFSVCVMTSRIWSSWLDMIKLVKTWLTNAYSTVTFQTSYFGILLKCNTLWSTEVFYCVFYYKPFMTKVAAIWCNNLMQPPPRQSCERGCKAHALEGKTHALLTPSAPLLDSWPHLSRSTFLHTLPFPSIGIVAALDPHI